MEKNLHQKQTLGGQSSASTDWKIGKGERKEQATKEQKQQQQAAEHWAGWSGRQRERSKTMGEAKLLTCNLI